MRAPTLFLFLTFIAMRAGFAAEEPIDADVLIRGGTLYIGDGQPPTVGDVAIVDDKIVAVGKFSVGQADYTVDCTGMAVCPGFIDLHNHSDEGILAKETRANPNYVTQGCTTIVTGNCGFGPVDTGKYLDAIDEYGAGVNVAHLLPQGALRSEVMGDEQRSATVEELTEMCQLADQAMLDGAWGMSTGLIYVPSSYADQDEIATIAATVGKHGGIYVSHIRNENLELLTAVEEALAIGRRGQLPVHVSHFKSSGKDSWGLVRVATEQIQKARDSGQIVTADQYPYTASNTSLEATLIPTWARSGGREAMLARFDSVEDRARIADAVAKKLVVLDDGHRIQIATYTANPSWCGKRLSEIAAEQKSTSIDIAFSILKNGGASIVNHSINEEDVRFVMQQPWVAVASDGSAKLPGPTVPHPRSYGTFSRKIGHYAIREKVIALEHAIRSATGLPADILGIQSRGYLRPGLAADVVVFDPQTFIDTATFANPHQHSKGLKMVYINGKPALVDGIPTGALVGQALRRE